MNITLNGKSVAFEKEVSVQQLLDEGYVEMQEYVTVQLNDRIVAREQYAETVIRDGDVMEFLYYMGGGAANDGGDERCCGINKTQNRARGGKFFGDSTFK